MSWNDERNKPDGKSCQWYYCQHPWEAKHIAGKGHKKQQELAATFGVSIEAAKYTIAGDFYGKFRIEGAPAKVNATKEAMSAWLQECQSMRYDKY
jgi:hypothetical protein